MKNDRLMQALGNVDSRYLEQCDLLPLEGKGRSSAGPLRRILIAAAVIALLAVSVSAAVGLARVRGSKLGKDSFLLYLEENPAAEDAPTEIAQYYLPEADPKELVLTHADENRKRGISVTWEKADHSGMARFTQELLASIPEDGVLTLVEGIDLDELRPGEAEIQGRLYTTYTSASEAGDTVWYYWVDEARYYLFCTSFTDGFTREEREAVLSSVRPLSPAEAHSEMGIPSGGYWMIEPDEARFSSQDRESVTCVSGLPASHLEWQDETGCGIVLEQNIERTDKEFRGCVWTSREINGISVEIGSRRGGGITEEYWRFAMPDGARLILAFWSPADQPMEDQVKLDVFDSLHLTNLPKN